jgi:hypothetical protein
MKRIALASLMACSIASAAADASRLYAAVAPIELFSNEGLQRLEVPLPVVRASRTPYLADVRVVDAQGRVVPIAWAHEPERGKQERSLPMPRFEWPRSAAPDALNAPGLKVRVSTTGAVVRIDSTGSKPASPARGPSIWLLDLSALKNDDEQPARITLDWPPRPDGISTTVRVESSNDARAWVGVTRAQLLELPGNDASAPALRHVDWPAQLATPRYVRLVFDTPLMLTRSDVTLVRTGAQQQLQRIEVRFAPVNVERDEPAQWSLDLLGRIDVRRLHLQLPEANTVVSLRLEQRNDAGQAWTPVRSFTAWRLVRDGRDAQSSAIEVEAPPARHWRLVADKRTRAFIDVSLAATLEWRAPQLVLVAHGGAGLQLAVGRDKDRSNAVPLPTLMPGYETGAELRLAAARLGTLTTRPVDEPGWPERLSDASPEDKQRWALWLVLAVAVAGLGLLAWRLAKDVSAARPQ